MTDGQRAALVVVTRRRRRPGRRRPGAGAALRRATTPSSPATGPTRPAPSWPRRGLPVAVLLGGLGGRDPDGLAVLRGLHRAAPGRDGGGAGPLGRLRHRAADLRGGDRWASSTAGSTRRRWPGDEEFHRAVTEILEEWSTRAGRRLRGRADDRGPLVARGPSTCATPSPATASRSASTTRTPPRARALLAGLDLDAAAAARRPAAVPARAPGAAGPQRPGHRRRVRPVHAAGPRRRSTTSWWSAPGRPGSGPACTPPRRG